MEPEDAVPVRESSGERVLQRDRPPSLLLPRDFMSSAVTPSSSRSLSIAELQERIRYLERTNVELAGRLSLMAVKNDDLEAKVSKLEMDAVKAKALENRNPGEAVLLNERLTAAQLRVADLTEENSLLRGHLESVLPVVASIDALKREQLSLSKSLNELEKSRLREVEAAKLALSQEYVLEKKSSESQLQSIEQGYARLRQELREALNEVSRLTTRLGNVDQVCRELETENEALKSQLTMVRGEQASRLASIDDACSHFLRSLADDVARSRQLELQCGTYCRVIAQMAAVLHLLPDATVGVVDFAVRAADKGELLDAHLQKHIVEPFRETISLLQSGSADAYQRTLNLLESKLAEKEAGFRKLRDVTAACVSEIRDLGSVISVLHKSANSMSQSVHALHEEFSQESGLTNRWLVRWQSLWQMYMVEGRRQWRALQSIIREHVKEPQIRTMLSSVAQQVIDSMYMIIMDRSGPGDDVDTRDPVQTMRLLAESLGGVQAEVQEALRDWRAETLGRHFRVAKMVRQNSVDDHGHFVGGTGETSLSVANSSPALNVRGIVDAVNNMRLDTEVCKDELVHVMHSLEALRHHVASEKEHSHSTLQELTVFANQISRFTLEADAARKECLVKCQHHEAHIKVVELQLQASRERVVSLEKENEEYKRNANIMAQEVESFMRRIEGAMIERESTVDHLRAQLKGLRKSVDDQNGVISDMREKVSGIRVRCGDVEQEAQSSMDQLRQAYERIQIQWSLALQNTIPRGSFALEGSRSLRNAAANGTVSS
jgi:chromosome segregation ATPase